MASLYNCICTDCNNQFQKSWGGGIRYRHLICTVCNDFFIFPRYAPRENREEQVVPTFLEKHDFKSRAKIDDENIKRFTKEVLGTFLNDRSCWSVGNDSWDDFELQEVLNELKRCTCNAEFKDVIDERVFIQCPACTSSQVKITLIGASD